MDLKKPQVIVFDVYQTLFDMGDVERKINSIMDSKRGYTIWFELFMQYCFVNNALDSFHDFISIAGATLQMTGRTLGRTASGTDADDVTDLLKHLPVYEEVQPCLSQLNDLGFTIAALTNAPEKIVCDRMERTGLISYFEKVLSAETIKKYKPDKKVYEWASQKLSTNITEMLMVTSHGWDIAGANNAGMQTAFVKTNKQIPYSLSAPPRIICSSLSDLVLQLRNENGTTGI
jgi:2-haloacid dehalogenase